MTEKVAEDTQYCAECGREFVPKYKDEELCSRCEAAEAYQWEDDNEI